MEILYIATNLDQRDSASIIFNEVSGLKNDATESDEEEALAICDRLCEKVHVPKFSLIFLFRHMKLQ